MYIPEVKSFKDLILWPLKFLYNLPVQYQALLGTALTVPILLLVLLQGRGTPADMMVTTEQVAWLRTGMVSTHADSVQIGRGNELRLLASQGSTYWAETPNGRYRGFVAKIPVGEQALRLTLPTREKRSSYYISRSKFDKIMADPEMTFERIERKYLPAEYIKPAKGGFRGEFGFYVVEPNGKKTRPVITFKADGTIDSYTCEPFHSATGPLSALTAWDEIAKSMPTDGGKAQFSAPENRWVDLISPLISTGDVGQFIPFNHLITNLIWTYLMGYLPLFLFVLLLWARKPLIWMPNGLVNAIAYLLCIVGPIVWYMILRVQGLSWFPMLLVMGVMDFVGFWGFYALFGGLRCPKCKVLEDPQKIKEQNGEPFVRWHYYNDEIERVHLTHRVETEVRTSYNERTHQHVKTTTEKHYYEDKVTYEHGKRFKTMRIITKSYVCRHCGLGTQDFEEEILKVEDQPSRTEVKYENYTKTEIH